MGNDELAAAEARISRRTQLWPALQTICMFVILLVGAIGLMYGFSAANSSDAVNHGNTLRECTTKESAKVTAAQTSLIRAGQARDSATQEYLQAAATNDTEAQNRLLTDAPALREKVADLSDELDQANRNYQDKLVQSRQNPSAFLRECRDD